MSDSQVNIFSKLERTLIGFSIVMAMVLGVIGYSQYYQYLAEPASIFDLLYNSVGLFILETSIDPGRAPVTLEIARWLAPASLSYAAFRAFAAIMRGHFHRLRISWLQGHAIICGLDSVNIRILEAIIAAGTSVVVIEANPQNKFIGRAKNLGAYILIGNSSDSTWLNQANLKKAAFLLAVTGYDHVNLEVAYYSYRQREKQTSLPMLNCAVHIANREFGAVLYQQPVFATDASNYSARIINYEQLAARWLLNNYGPDKLLDQDAMGSRLFTIALVGDSRLIEEILLRVACIGHYGQPAPLNVKLVSPDATKHLEGLLSVQPALANILELSAYDTSLGILDSSHSHEVLHEVKPDLVYVHAESTEQILTWTQALENLKLKCPIIVCESGESVIPGMLEQQFGSSANIHCVRVMRDSCRFDTVFDSQQDSLAIAIHKNYVNSQRAMGDTQLSNSSLVDWSVLPENLKDANRNQADHLYIKCQSLTGKRFPTVTEVEEALNDASIERVASMEHARWKAEKELNGWRLQQGEKDNERRLSPSLVAWEQLSEAEKQKDRDAVRHLPELVNLLKQLA
ncbi:Uncharacterised protein [Halioglobus japonicus]|nr:Uncharacterised protein [Halioglobus japonicus]